MAADPQLNAIEEAAAAWLVERDVGLSPARAGELDHWLRADERHAAAFHALGETWALIGEGAAAPDEREASFSLPARTEKKTWFPLGFAAAAALAIAAAGWWRTALVTAERPTPFALTASTDVGRQREVKLPDGSLIRLNTDSIADVRFEVDERRVRLVQGEAHFTVARQHARPFVVSAAGVDVRAVGTVFNVRLRPESVDVLVTEGKVRVAAPASGTLRRTSPELPTEPMAELTAGQKVSIALTPASTPAPAAPVAVSTAEIRQALAWQARRLDFDATPLREIVAEFNRYNRHQLIVPDARLNAQRFGGSFPASDYVTFVRMLEANFGVVAEREGDETRLRLRRSQ